MHILKDGSILDEKDIASLSLVDAVVHHGSHLKLRPSQTKVEPTSSQSVAPGALGEGGVRVGEQGSKSSGDAMDVDHPSSPVGASTGGSGLPALDLPSSKVTVLRGHQSEVFTCAWNPQGDMIVSG